MSTTVDIGETVVSVVIPFCDFYTPRSMLDEAIASVNAQTVPTEIIVVEDRQQQGPAWARNRGLDRATARYVAFLDADDLWKPNKLERQLKKMQRQNVGLSVEGSDMGTDEFIRRLLVGPLVSLTPSILIDREKVETRFPEDLDRYEDHFFLVEAAAQGGICLCEDLITVRKHQGGLSASGTSVMEHRAMLELADKLDRRPEIALSMDEVRRHVHYKYARQLQWEGNWQASLKFFFKSIQYGLRPKTVAAMLLVPYYSTRLYLNGQK